MSLTYNTETIDKITENFIREDDIPSNTNTQGDKMAGETENIGVYHRRRKKVKDIIASRKNEHGDAYRAGIEAIVGKGKDLKDFSKLEVEGNQDKLIDAMVKHYVKRAKEYLHSKPVFVDKDDEKFHNDELLKLYTGKTEAELRKSIKEHIGRKGGHAFTQDEYSGMHDEHTQKISIDLGRSAADHLKDEDIDDIISYTGVGEYLKGKARPQKEEAAVLLDAFDEGHRKLSGRILEELGFGKYLKDKYKRTKKEEKKEVQYQK